MTSPNRETEAQQVKALGEHQKALTKVKASLREKKGEIGVNLAVQRIITDQEQEAGTVIQAILKQGRREMATAIISDQEQAVMVMLKISKQDRQEMVKEVTSNPEMAKEAALNPEKVTAVISGQELVPEETEMPKILKADRREMARAAASDQKARGALVAPQVSNRVHSKKAVLKKCQEMKAAIM